MNIRTFAVTEYLDWINVPWHGEGSKNVRRGWIGIECLYCTGSRDHLGISLTYKNFSCWRCKESGSIMRLIMDLEDISFAKAAQRIDDFQDFLTQPELVLRERREGAPIIDEALPLGCSKELMAFQQEYLENRRFDPAVLQSHWDLRAGPVAGDGAYRIILPVKFQNKVWTWIGMDATRQNPPKYLAQPVEKSFMPASELLYGLDMVKDNVLVVEGPTDAWRMGPGAVALLGMGITDWKVKRLVDLSAKKYYVMLDGEPEAIRNAHTLANRLSNQGLRVEVLELDHGDPDDMTQDEANHWRKELSL